jgi:hypothetical protein
MAVVVIEWNGREVPGALLQLPPGRYMIEPVDDLLDLTPEEGSGLMQAMDSLDAGKGVALEDVLAELPARFAAA